MTLTIVLNAVLSRVNEAQEKLKRCCIAFADMCCAQSKTETGCCETACQDEHGTFVPHLDSSGGTGTTRKVAEGLKAEKEGSETVDKSKTADVEEEIVLEVVGMDCPDCLSKVTQAVRILSGAEVINADGVRGLVSVKYDPRKLTSAGLSRELM
jgi:copper chaperone CopZ